MEENNKQTWDRLEVKHTPFSIMRSAETGECKITCGNNLMSDVTFINEKAARKYIFQKPYELILNTMALMATNIFNNLKNQQQ